MRSVIARPIAAFIAFITASGLLVSMPTSAVAAPATVTQTYGYTGAADTFTVPAGITVLTIELHGGEGGQGGDDASGPSPAGGYQGVVSGTLAVTPGDVLTIAVGQGGATGLSQDTGSSDPAHYTDGAAAGGQNPLGYNGGNGGVAGYDGDSGDGGAGGGATVVTINSSTIVAGGAGGAGGSGQFPVTLGRVPYSTFTARADDPTATAGQDGITVAFPCAGTASCDGGGGGAGGGGVSGGAQGDVQFGSGDSDEWYGYGGYPGQNSTGGAGGLTASYQYYPDDSADGSVTISYSTGAPGAPTAVSGVAGDGSVAVGWTAPSASGESSVSDYVVEYALASDPNIWTTFADSVSTATSTTVTGLSDDTAYVFQVSAVNTAGQGDASTPSDPVTPIGVPSAPTITSVTAHDGALSLAFTPPNSGSAPTTYEYQLNGVGAWVTALTTTSPLQISGLTNGTLYSIQIRGNSVVGEGAASPASSGIPEALAGAPSISSTSTGVGTAIVSFTPGYSGGVAISDYEYDLNDSGTWTSTGSATSPLTISGLANATTYAIAIRSVTTSGGGAASADANVTTPDTPAAPIVGSIVPGDTTLAIPFTAGATGGSTITSYEYQLVTSGPWITATSASPLVVTGLTNGTTYQVSLRAINAVGTGPAATAQTAVPTTVPGPPIIVGDTVAGSNHQLSAAFTAPASDGGSPVIGYDYSTDAGATWRTAGTTSSPIVISVLSLDGTTPLVNGATYFVELRAISAIGVGTASAVATGIAQTVPSAPGIASVTPGPSSLAVTIAPASNGGAAITSYQYQLGSSGWVNTGTLGTSFLIGSLTNGTPYGVTVRAINAQGPSPASGSTAGTPRTTPAEPTITSVARGDRSLSVGVADASNGGSAITSWQFSTDSGSTWFTAAQSVSPLVITTLSTDGITAIANGTSYPVGVRAVNAAGASAPSETTGVGPSTTPVAPGVVLGAANQAIQVTFTVADNGGSPISAIEYRLNAGSWIDAGTLSSPFVIGALTNGTSYTVNVRADNAIGVGTGSIPASATPLTVPGAPTSISAVSDTTSADVSWTPPGNTGGSPITTYVASAYATPSSQVPLSSCTTSSTSCMINGLTDGIGYYISAIAQNAAGSSSASTPLVAVTPLERPGAPSLNSLTSGDSFLSLDFNAGTDGDAPVTSYQYQLNGGAWLPASSTTTPLTITSVANGTSYDVALRGVSSAGAGAASTVLTATPYTFPDAPDASTTVAAGVAGVAGAITVTWLAPNDNGSPITSYTATAFDAPTAGSQVTTCTTANLTCTLNGLSDNTLYYVSLQSMNAAGFSSRSARIAVATSLLPGAVSAVTGTPGDGQVVLSWTPGGDGASPVSDYTVWYSTGGSYTQFADGVSTASAATVTGLTNGTPYTFEVYAVNNGGTGPVSDASDPVTPAALPDAPSIGIATAVNVSATIAWTPPADSGGDPVTGYVITPSIGTPITVGNVTSYVLGGLANGTAYTFQVAAITAAGTGARSSASNSVTPHATAPGAPAILTATAGNSSVSLTWTAPSDNGGNAVTGYLITPTSGPPVTVGNVTGYTVTGLTNGIGYAFVIAAINTIGTGGNSTPSGSVTPNPTVPAAPTLVVGTPGNATVAIVWTPPTDNGGSTVTGFVITPSSGSPVIVGNVTSHTFSALTNGIGYTFTVAAINAIGTGTPSVSSTLVTPGPTAPGIPIIAIASAGNTSATLAWTPPSDDGGSAVTGYVITPSSGAPVTVGNVVTYQLTALTNGTAYTFAVAAINAVATGANSSASNSVTPHTTAPGAPTIVSASAGNTTATLTWMAPVDDGGFAITGYLITPSSGSPITVGDVTTYTMTGLTNGTGYTFMVAAINQLGTGTPSFVASNPVTPQASGGPAAPTPSAPTRVFGTDRFGTAVATSVLEFPATGSAGAVVLARSDDYPDALVGVRLAAAKNAPLLFANGGTLTTATQAELVRVLPAGGTVYLLGGATAIPESIATTLSGLGYDVQRFAGTDRFGTALAVAAALGNPGTVLLATGINFPDALAAGPAAAHIDGVVLLTDGSVLPASVRAYLSAHPGVVYAVGGPAVAADPSAIALTGTDRYATAVAVAALFSGPTKLGVASGTTFADALSGGAFVARVDGPLLLTAPSTLPSSTTGYLDTVKSTVLTSTLFGGPMAVGPTVANAVGAALGAT